MSRRNKLTIDWKLSICTVLLAMCTVNSGGFLASNQGAFAQSSKSPQKSPRTTQPTKPNRNGWLIDKIRVLLNPHKRSGGSTDRPIFNRSFSISRRNETGSATVYSQDSVCILSPIFNPNPKVDRLLWTRKPLFVWAGYSSGLQLVDARSNKIVWQKKVTEESGRIEIDRPLEAGKSYILRSFSHYDPERVKLETTFQTVTATDWEQINRDLLSIEQASIAKKQTQAEISLQKATYFAKRQLWGDVQTTILSIWQDEKEGKQINSINPALPNDEIQILLTEIENTFPICSLDRL
jgi:hypothetical protein